MSEKTLQLALDFIESEKQFHLGFLPTEQSNQLTKNLDKEFASGTIAGVKNLQCVDRNVLAMAKRIFVSDQFRKLVDAGEKNLRSHRTAQHSARMYVAGLLRQDIWRGTIRRSGLQHHDGRRLCPG